MTDNREPALRAILAFYQEAGVDAVLTESPLDRLAERPPPRQAVTANVTLARSEAPRPVGPLKPARGIPARPATAIASLAPEAAVAAARAAAKAAASLDELKEMLR